MYRGWGESGEAPGLEDRTRKCPGRRGEAGRHSRLKDTSEKVPNIISHWGNGRKICVAVPGGKGKGVGNDQPLGTQTTPR